MELVANSKLDVLFRIFAQLRIALSFFSVNSQGQGYSRGVLCDSSRVPRVQQVGNRRISWRHCKWILSFVLPLEADEKQQRLWVMLHNCVKDIHTSCDRQSQDLEDPAPLMSPQ